MEDRTIDKVVDIIRFISHSHYHDVINNWLCHKLKENDPQAIDYCARQLAKMLPENAVIVPIPGHHGYALQTLYLARAISVQSDGSIPVANVLKGKSRVSNYQAKMDGHPLSSVELGFRQVGLLPKGKIPYLLDNCVDSGETAKAAYHALGQKGIILSYAMSDKLLDFEIKHSSGLSR
jgi:predicted amidophosphoribosyltransferase